MFKFTKSDFEKYFKFGDLYYNYLFRFTTIMSLRSHSESINFLSYISHLKDMADLNSFDKVYSSLSTDEKHLFAFFTRLSLNHFSASDFLELGHSIDHDCVDFFVEKFDIFDSLLIHCTFYQTFRVLSLALWFLHFAACNPVAFHFEPVSDDVTYDKFVLQRYWSKVFPQLDEFYNR